MPEHRYRCINVEPALRDQAPVWVLRLRGDDGTLRTESCPRHEGVASPLIWGEYVHLPPAPRESTETLL